MKIKKEIIILFLIICSLMKPTGFAIEDGGINAYICMAMVITRFSITIVLAFLFIVKRKKEFEIKVLLLFSIFTFVNFLANDNGCTMYQYWNAHIGMLGMSLLVAHYGSKSKINLLIDAFFKSFSIVIILDLINMLIITKGNIFSTMFGITSDISFLSIDNWLADYTIPYFLIIMLHSELFNKGKFNAKYLILSMLDLLMILMTWSGTAVIAFLLVGLITLFYKLFPNTKGISLRTYFGIYLCLFLLICVFNYTDFLGFIIEGFLHKTMTFTGRNIAWKNAIDAIIKNPVLGYGYGYKVYYGMNAHNGLLELLVQGGIIGTILYFTLYLKPISILKKYKNLFIVKVYSATFFAFLLMMITEAQIEYTMYYGIIVLACYLPEVFSYQYQNNYV